MVKMCHISFREFWVDIDDNCYIIIMSQLSGLKGWISLNELCRINIESTVFIDADALASMENSCSIKKSVSFSNLSIRLWRCSETAQACNLWQMRANSSFSCYAYFDTINHIFCHQFDMFFFTLQHQCWCRTQNAERIFCYKSFPVDAG